jgi:ribosomal protein S18 acetylase RimI-like enzyme
MGNDVKIRNATRGDSIELYKCGKRNLPLYYSYNEFNQMIYDDENHILGVSGDDKNIFGYIVSNIRDNNAHILSFGVDKKYRRQKIGTKLIKYIENKCACVTMTLYVHVENKDAITFYEKCGFNIINTLENYYGGSLKEAASQNAYYMKKMLK